MLTSTSRDENTPPPQSSTTTRKKETIFRGDWAPTLEVPLKWGFQGLQFRPVAPPIEPSGKVEVEPQITGGKFNGPPPGVDVLFEVQDRCYEYRGCIAKDGCVTNAYHQVIGYINGNQAGSASERYLGRVHETRFDNQYQVWAATTDGMDEDLIATIDMGTCSVKHRDGGTAFDIKIGGKILHPNGTELGVMKGMRSFHEIEVVALYLLLIDPTFTADDAAPISS